uniref:Putative cytochrome oxidase assembly protein n=1 Tax=uncultured bacterium 888 TaxID=548896 RepID=B8R8N7_9BACT|nr:putative cytochrome oxidase assembly protein [uncultured bacterium 888]
MRCDDGIDYASMDKEKVLQTNRRRIAAWLLACCTLLFVLIVVGGVTRLTRSGLSIVEWQPIVGTLPPMSEAQWLEVFDKYKQTPEYRQVNFGMSLEAFKGIFWWEYVHRLLGRLLGLAFFAPMLWFLLRRQIDRKLGLKLAGILVLGALQGLMGWYMVKSGLVDDPRVSHFRLTAHLGLAFLIFAAMFWVAFDLLRSETQRSQPAPLQLRLAAFAVALVWVVFLMVLTGGLVAGIRAGSAYNTFPLMNGHVAPPEIFMIEPWHLNFFNNMATVQFDHRLLAWLLAFFVPRLWFACRRLDSAHGARVAANALLFALALQIALGIATLVMHVPIALAAAHQAGAVVVFATTLALAHVLRK